MSDRPTGKTKYIVTEEELMRAVVSQLAPGESRSQSLRTWIRSKPRIVEARDDLRRDERGVV